VSKRLVLTLSSLLVVFFLCLLPIPASYAQEHKTFSPPVRNTFSWHPTPYVRRAGPPENYVETENLLVEPSYETSLKQVLDNVEIYDNTGGSKALIDAIPAYQVVKENGTFVRYRPPSKNVYLFTIENVRINGREPPFHTEKLLNNATVSLDVRLSDFGKKLIKSVSNSNPFHLENYYITGFGSISPDDISKLGDFASDLDNLPVYQGGSLKKKVSNFDLSLDNSTTDFEFEANLENQNAGYACASGRLGSHSISWTVSSQTDWESVTDSGLSENYYITDGVLNLGYSYDVSIGEYNDNLDVSGQDGSASGIAWDNDGTKFYVVGYGNDAVYEYSVSTPWDVSTASYTDNLDVSGRDGGPTGIAWDNEGTKLYIAGAGNDNIYEYSVSTAWDISTANYTDSLDISGQDTGPTGIAWNDNGSKLYMSGGAGDSLYEYSVSTAWDVSTASYNDSFYVSRDDEPRNIVWNSDGTKFYVVGYGNDAVYEYSVSTAWDVSTASYVDNLDVSLHSNYGMGGVWDNSGTKFYEVDYGNDYVHEFLVGEDNGIWVQKPHQYSEAQTIDNITMTVDNLGGGLSVKVQTSNDNFSTVKGDTGWMSITTTGTVTKVIGDISGEYMRVKFDLTRGSTPEVVDYTITTNEPPNTPENLSPVGRIASTTSTSITADIVDPEGDNVNVYFWDNETGSLIDNVWITSDSTASVTWSGLSEGQTYSYKVSAKDNYGTSSDNSYVESFTVNTPPNSPENLSPSGTIESSAVDISAVAVDNESDNVTVYFYDNSDDSLIGSAQVGSGENATVTWENLSSGDHSFYTKAGDSWDNSSLSEVRTFTVQLSDEPTISQVTINSGTIDRDVTTDYTDVYENLTATVRVSDNDGWGAIKRLGAWVRDNSDAVLVDNVRVAENTQVDSKTLDFTFTFNPSDNSDIGKYDLRFQSLDNADLTDNYPYSPDFTVDDIGEVTISVTGYSDGSADISGHAELLSGRDLTLTKAKVIDSQEGEISIGASENDYSGTYGISRGPHTVHVDVKASVSSYLDGSSGPFTFTYSAEAGGGGVAPSLRPLSISIETGTITKGALVEQSVFGVKDRVAVGIRVTSNGRPVDARIEASWAHGGAEEKIELTEVGKGEYRGTFTVPEGIQEGTYVISVSASKPGYEDASATKTFSVGIGPIPWWAKFQDELVIVALIFLAFLPIIVARVR